MKYKVQQLNLASHEHGTIIETDDLAVAIAKMNRPGSCYRRVIEKRGKLWRNGFKVVANVGSGPVK